MFNRIFLFIVFFIPLLLKGQVVVIPIIVSSSMVSEHGFLPGKQFQFYSTIKEYDFGNKRFRVELFDDRKNLKLEKVDCSEISFTNTSEFASPGFIFTVGQYIDTLLRQSKAILDTMSTDTLKIKLQGFDVRLIGAGYVRVHGLCQIAIEYHHELRTFCTDITDADKNSPIGPSAIVTRKTATRIMASAAVREVVEQMINDLISRE
jgi:hypothetical protein